MTTFDNIIEMFLRKVTSYSWSGYLDAEKDYIIDGYMIAACSKFYTCDVNLSDRDNNNRIFNRDLTDEIIDIITDGMIVEWLKPIYYNSDNFEMVLSTRDLSASSIGNLLKEIRESYVECKNSFNKAIKDYSYNHNDVRGLNI
jgi:predicted AlkP superfamily phosphohydrolase/phosphomutase